MADSDPSEDRQPWYRSPSVKRLPIAALLVVVVIAWQADAFTAKTPAGEVADSRPSVGETETVVVRRSMEPVLRSLIGTIAARRKTELRARIAAQVERVAVEAGQRVEAGELLVELDREVPQARLDEAEAALDVARAELRGAREQFARIEEATAADASPETALIAARQGRDAAEKMVEQREAARRAARTQLGYTRITAPRSGLAVDPLVDPGDYLLPGQPVVELFEPAESEILLDVPASLAGRIWLDQALDCEIGAIDATLPGTVRAIVPRADPRSQTVRIKLSIEPPSGAGPGMFVRVMVPGVPREALLVPATAVERVRQLDFVRHVDEQGRVSRRAVRAGRRFGESSEILAGLRDGDRVVRDAASRPWFGGARSEGRGPGGN